MNFCSDNVSGIHPRILDALIAGNDGDVMPYGADAHTRRAAIAQRLFRQQAHAQGMHFVAARMVGVLGHSDLAAERRALPAQDFDEFALPVAGHASNPDDLVRPHIEGAMSSPARP